MKIWDLTGILNNMYRVVLLDLQHIEENDGWASVELELAEDTNVTLYYKEYGDRVYGYFVVTGDKEPDYDLLDEEVKWLKV